MLAGARTFGIFPALHEPNLREWIWLGTILSALSWGLVVYLVPGSFREEGSVRSTHVRPEPRVVPGAPRIVAR
jgi:hypothetical protein